MRKFNTHGFGIVDLDDEATYSYLPNEIKQLDNLMFCEIGKALAYIDYFPDRKMYFPKRKNKKNDLKNSGYNQRQRVYKLIETFAKNRHKNHENEIMWYKEQIFLFQEETENMC